MTKLTYIRKVFSLCLMILLGGLCIQLSMHSSAPVRTEESTTINEAPSTAVFIPEPATPSNVVTAVTSVRREAAYVPNAARLNLAYIFPEEADTTDIGISYAKKAFEILMKKDEEWYSNLFIYGDFLPETIAERLELDPSAVMGNYNPLDEYHDPDNPETWVIHSFKRVHTLFTDGDGNPSNGASNVIPIMSMANTYMFYHDPYDYDAYLDYVLDLWNASHSYTIRIGDVYYCDGCIEEDAQSPVMIDTQKNDDPGDPAAVLAATPSDAEMLSGAIAAEVEVLSGTAAADVEVLSGTAAGAAEVLSGTAAAAADANVWSTATPSNASGASGIHCPGHVDIYITAMVLELDDTHGLYEADEGKRTGWYGWDSIRRGFVSILNNQDWYEQYGLSVSMISLRTPLTLAEITFYLDMLPENLSEERRKVVEFALSSVGQVPYYWGGKPKRAGYTGNDFGVIVPPDIDGRILNGLDCSGWINWVYWSALGERLSYEGTAGLTSLGRRIDRSQLQPGDIMIRTGSQPHVVMFLRWMEDGRIQCIEETSGTINNVCLTVKEANWQYYQNLID